MARTAPGRSPVDCRAAAAEEEAVAAAAPAPPAEVGNRRRLRRLLRPHRQSHPQAREHRGGTDTPRDRTSHRHLVCVHVLNPPAHVVGDSQDEAPGDLEWKGRSGTVGVQVLPEVGLDLGAARFAEGRRHAPCVEPRPRADGAGDEAQPQGHAGATRLRRRGAAFAGASTWLARATERPSPVSA